MFDQNATHLRHVFGLALVKTSGRKQQKKIAERRNVILTVQNKVVNCYHTFEEFFKSLRNCWNIKINDKYVQMSDYGTTYVISYTYICIDEKERISMSCSI